MEEESGNWITALKLESRDWHYNENETKDIGSQFYEDLYVALNLVMGKLIYDFSYPSIDEGSMCLL